MRNLLNGEDRRSIINRIEKLHPDVRREWGRLTVEEMICHLQDVFYYTCGEKEGKFKKPLMSNLIGRFMVLYAPMAWPRGKIIGPKEAFVSTPGEFEDDKKKLISYIERFNESTIPNALRHPIIGVLNSNQWGIFQYKHCDHHLKQFAV